jgi:uncharacterized protein
MMTEVLPAGATGKPRPFHVDEHDAQAGLFTVRKGQHEPFKALVLSPFFGPESVWLSLMSLGERALADAVTPAGAAFALLDRRPPLPSDTMAGLFGESAQQRARRLLATLSTGLLPVQGPPGTGKTHLAAQLVKHEIERAKAQGRQAVIGVTANSHRVIDNLLAAVLRASADWDAAADVVHVVRHGGVELRPGVDYVSSGKEVRQRIDQATGGRPLVIGGTKYVWAREDVAGTLGLLIVDEAGQVALADAVACGEASPRIVALGDPQQLAAPIQAAHDESVRVSLLEHVARGHAVLPESVGVFLDTSFRMHPALCEVVGRLAYEGALNSSVEAAARTIEGSDLFLAGQRLPVRPGLEWLPVEGGEDAEASAVEEIVEGLVGNALVTDDGATKPLVYGDILVVAPHNAHVNRIAARIGNRVRVGTVDKFQGQEGHVVIYSMGRLAAAPSDVPFLYDLNRVNVALSRARLLAVVVSHPDAVFPPVAKPEHVILASRFAEAVRGVESLSW